MRDDRLYAKLYRESSNTWVRTLLVCDVRRMDADEEYFDSVYDKLATEWLGWEILKFDGVPEGADGDVV